MSKEKKKKNEEELLAYINPALEYIFEEILISRIKKLSDKNLKVNYETDNNKFINLSKGQNPQNPHNFEFNIYIFFCEEERKYLEFIVENWKFKINVKNSEYNDLNGNTKKILQKKLHTFIRSIKSLLCLLPLYALVQDIENKNFDYTFEAHLYKESNIDMGLENEIKNEKNQIKVEMKDDRLVDILLTINYITKKGIFKHQDNLKKVIDYKGYYTKYYGEKMTQKMNSKISKININTKDNTNLNINRNMDINKEDKKDINTNMSLLFEEADNENELMLSNLIPNSIINNNNDLNEKRLSQIKKSFQENKNINLDKLYSSCFDNLEDINCRKNGDEILDVDTLMNKEKKILNDIKYNFNFRTQNNLIDEVYEEMDGYEINNLMKYPNKIHKKKNNNNDNSNDENKNIRFVDLMEDYFSFKSLIN